MSPNMPIFLQIARLSSRCKNIYASEEKNHEMRNRNLFFWWTRFTSSCVKFSKSCIRWAFILIKPLLTVFFFHFWRAQNAHCPFINKCQLNCQCYPYHSTCGTAWQKPIGPLSYIQMSFKCHVSFIQPLPLGLQVIQNQVSQPPATNSDEEASNWIWKYLSKTLQHFVHLNVTQRI